MKLIKKPSHSLIIEILAVFFTEIFRLLLRNGVAVFFFAGIVLSGVSINPALLCAKASSALFLKASIKPVFLVSFSFSYKDTGDVLFNIELMFIMIILS